MFYVITHETMQDAPAVSRVVTYQQTHKSEKAARMAFVAARYMPRCTYAELVIGDMSVARHERVAGTEVCRLSEVARPFVPLEMAPKIKPVDDRVAQSDCEDGEFPVNLTFADTYYVQISDADSKVTIEFGDNATMALAAYNAIEHKARNVTELSLNRRGPDGDMWLRRYINR